MATSLTSLGFAQVIDLSKDLSSNEVLRQYHKNLQKVQNKAKRSRTGLWSEMYTRFNYFESKINQLFFFLQNSPSNLANT